MRPLMLVLNRKKNQEIIINNNIKITIIECNGDHVKIGIDAPPSIKVYRSEIYQAIEAENRDAASSLTIPLIQNTSKNESSTK